MSLDLYLFRIRVYIEGFNGILYTGKLVKTILINKLPEYTELFKAVKGNIPKLLHITPLYRVRGNKIKCIYSYVPCRSHVLARCKGNPSPVKLEGIYDFYVGFTSNVLDHNLFVDRMIDLDTSFTYMNKKINVSILEFEYIDPRDAIEKIIDNILSKGKLKIIFASPTMLRDPFRRSRYKSLVPTVMNIFSTPLYIMLHNTGTYSLRRFRRQLMILHKIFSETYSTLKTIQLKWVVYKKKPEPMITGYVNLRMNKDYLDYYWRYIDMREYLKELLAHMITLGVGVGRATGFGHVFIE